MRFTRLLSLLLTLNACIAGADRTPPGIQRDAHNQDQPCDGQGGGDDDGDPPATGDAIKWHPGHYTWLDTVKSSSEVRVYHMAAIDALAKEPDVQGVLIGLYWGDLEGDQGDYSNGFAILDEYVARAAQNGKRVMVRIYDRVFGGIDPAYLHTGYYFPTYLEADTYDGGWYSLPGQQSLNTIAKMWNPAVMDRMIALTEAYGARYDGNPAFEMIGLEETSVNAGALGGGYSDGAYIEQLQRWMTAARLAWPHTGVRLQLNYFISAYAACADLVARASILRISLGGPDTLPPGVANGLDWGDLAYLGDNGRINYTGIIPMVAENQDYSLSNGFTLPDLFAGGIARGAQYFIWYQNSYSQLQWDADILPFIRSINGDVYSTACPTSYPGCTTE